MLLESLFSRSSRISWDVLFVNNGVAFALLFIGDPRISSKLPIGDFPSNSRTNSSSSSATAMVLTILSSSLSSKSELGPFN